MPLIIIGLIFLIGILIVQIIKYVQEKKIDTSKVRDKYKDVFSKKDDESEGKEKTLYFPTDNVENEKHKRNIH